MRGPPIGTPGAQPTIRRFFFLLFFFLATLDTPEAATKGFSDLGLPPGDLLADLSDPLLGELGLRDETGDEPSLWEKWQDFPFLQMPLA